MCYGGDEAKIKTIKDKPVLLIGTKIHIEYDDFYDIIRKALSFGAGNYFRFHFDGNKDDYLIQEFLEN